MATTTTIALASVGNIQLQNLLEAWVQQGDPVAGAVTADFLEEHGASATAEWVRERLRRMDLFRDEYMAPLEQPAAPTTAQKRASAYVRAFQRSILCVDPFVPQALDFGRDTPVSGKAVALRLRLQRLEVCQVQVLDWPRHSDKVIIQYRALWTHLGHPRDSYLPRHACPDCAAELRAGLWLLALLETLLPPAARNGDPWQLFDSPTRYPSLRSTGWQIRPR
jgi:hypothetical protein